MDAPENRLTSSRFSELQDRNSGLRDFSRE